MAKVLIHALSFAQRNQLGGIVYVWGENSILKSYNFSALRGPATAFRAEGVDEASLNTESPGGMPGGLLMLSSKPSAQSGFPYAVDFGSAILWAVYPKYGDVNKGFAEGQLVAYDATTIAPGNKLNRLYRTGDVNHCRAPDNQLKVCSQLKIYGLK